MDNTTALHTAARRYCQQRFSDSLQIYKELQGREKTQVADMFKPSWRYSEEACRTFPRYRLDAAIQMEVERLTPDCEANLEQLRTRLVRACDVAEMRFQESLQTPLNEKLFTRRLKTSGPTSPS